MSVRHPRALRLAASLALFAVAALAFTLSSSTAASASSYSGVDDWVIPFNTTENVTGETIVVNGFLTVNGTLNLVNSSLTIIGRIGPPVGPLQGPAREAAKAYINGTLNLTNSTLLFFVPYAQPPAQSLNELSPPGLRVRGNVTFRDFDNKTSTPEDQSILTAYGAGSPVNGSYNIFYPGSNFTFLNSYAELLGIRGFPGFEFNASTSVSIYGAFINNSVNATVFNDCNNVYLSTSLFNDTAQPLHIRGGTGHRLDHLDFVSFVLGVQLTGVTDTVIDTVSIHSVIGQINYQGWATPGSSLAFNNSSLVSVRALNVTGNLTDPSSEFVRLIEARSSSGITLQDVDLGGARGLGTLVNVNNILFEHVIATGFIDGLTLTNCSNVFLYNSSMTGDAPHAFQATGGSNYAFVNYSAGVRNAIWLIGIDDVLIDHADLNATQGGLRALQGSNFTVRGLTVRGPGTALWLDGISDFNADAPQLEFGFYGMEIASSRRVTITQPTLSTPPGLTARRVLFFNIVTDIRITDLQFNGECDAAARVFTATTFTLDGFATTTCGDGFALDGSQLVTLRNLFLDGAWNGTALSISQSTDVSVDFADLKDAWGYSLAIGASQRVRASRIDGRGGGAGGLVVLVSGLVDILDSDFSLSAGNAVALYNTTGSVSLTRVNASSSDVGVEILGSPGTMLRDVVANGNRFLGVDLDWPSTGVTLWNLTLDRNQGDGLFIGANGSIFVDGNISNNVGGGVAGALGVRFDWTILAAGSIVNDSLHLKGVLTVGVGASFLAEDAVIRVDEGTSIIDPLPDGRITVDGELTLNRVTLRPVNDTRPYGVATTPGSLLTITSSNLTGGGFGSTSSTLSIRGDTIIDLAWFTAWHTPLDFAGASADVRRSTFSNNTQGPRFGGSASYLVDLLSEDNAGTGLTLFGPSSATLVRAEIRFNSGTGLAASDVSPLTLIGLNLTQNLQGGLSMANCVPTVVTLHGAANVGFGVFLSGIGGGTFTDIRLEGGSGVGFHSEALGPIELTNLWITQNGGNGIEAAGNALVALHGGIVSGGLASGLVADAAVLTIDGTVFDRNAGPHLWIKGNTLATATNMTLRDAALDAAVVEGSAHLEVFRARIEGNRGRLIARDLAYAYSLNSSFSSFAAESSAQVDVAWDVRVSVLLSSGGAAPGATVDVFNAAGASLGSNTTNSSGEVPSLAVLEKTVLSGGRETSFTPHRIVASLALQGNARRNVTVDQFRAVVLRLDSEGPTVAATLSGTTGQGGWYLDQVTVTLEASDSGGTGLSILWRLQGGPWNEYATTADFGSTLLIVATEGVNHIEYYAIDGAGNSVPITDLVVRIDLAPPTAVWQVNETARSGRNISLSWTAVDGNGSGVTSVRIEAAFQGGPFTPWTNATGSGTATFTGEEGDWALRLLARDASGRSSGEVLLRVNVLFTGELRIAVYGANGLPLSTATVEVVGANQSQTGAGSLTFRLPEGDYTVRVLAPGYKERTFTTHLAAGNTTDLGQVQLEALTAEAGGGGLALLLAGVAALAAVALAVVFLMRRPKKSDPTSAPQDDDWKSL